MLSHDDVNISQIIFLFPQCTMNVLQYKIVGERTEIKG